jgi:hypothetical protein
VLIPVDLMSGKSLSRPCDLSFTLFSNLSRFSSSRSGTSREHWAMFWPSFNHFLRLCSDTACVGCRNVANLMIVVVVVSMATYSYYSYWSHGFVVETFVVEWVLLVKLQNRDVRALSVVSFWKDRQANVGCRAKVGNEGGIHVWQKHFFEW